MRGRWQWFVLAGGVMVVAAGCGTTSAAAHHKKTKVTASAVSHAKPTTIYATPKGTLGVTSPLPDGESWLVAGDGASKGVYLLNLSSKKIATSTSVTNSASAIAESSTGIVALGMGTPTSGAVEFLNGSTGSPIKTVAVSGPVESVAAGENGVTFYALNGNATARAVAIINSTTGKITGSVASPKDGVAVVVSPNQQSAYILEPNGNVDEVALPGGQLESLFPIGHSGIAEVLNPAGTTLYVLKGQGTIRNVAVVNIATEKVETVLPAPANANSVAISPDGATLYVAAGTPTYGNVQAYHLS
jgi:hypothetical protein